MSGPRPFCPPRSVFADEAHYASVLALMDGEDRLGWADGVGYEILSDSTDNRVFFAEWAARSALRVAPYLDGSQVERGPLHTTRPEWSRLALLLRASIVHERARQILAEPRYATFRVSP